MLQGCESPWDDAHADLVLFGGVEHQWPRAQRRHRHAYPRLLRVADGNHADEHERRANE